jgi:xanthine/uracil permease
MYTHEATSRITTEHDGRSATDLFKELRDEVTRLVRQEVALAKTEMSEKTSRWTRNGAYLAAGAAIAFAGFTVLLLAAAAGLYVGLVAAGLSHATAGWLAPLIVGVIVAAIGYGLIQKAISTFKHESAVPERTVQSLADNKQWVKEKVR